MEQESTFASVQPIPGSNTEAKPTITSNNGLPKNILIPLGALALVAIAAVVIYGISRFTQPGLTQEDVSVSRVDLSAAQGAARLPEGMPAGLPIETANITESMKANYTERGAFLYSVAYSTSENKVGAYTSWLNYMRASGYSVPPAQQDLQNWSLRGEKGGDELLVAFSDAEEGALVQVSYLDRADEQELQN